MLTPELQAAFIEDAPKTFLPVAGGWGKGGATHIRLAEASEDVLLGALHTAWKLRIEKNRKPAKTRNSPTRSDPSTKPNPAKPRKK
jgi:hypothetical protein